MISIPKLTLEAAVRKDRFKFDIMEHDALDKAQWREWIYVADLA